MTLKLDSGVNAKDYEAVAKKESLKPIEVVLRQIEDASSGILQEFEAMRDREQVQRDLNGENADDKRNANSAWPRRPRIIMPSYGNDQRNAACT